MAFKDRVQSLESVVHTSFREVETTLTLLTNTIQTRLGISKQRLCWKRSWERRRSSSRPKRRPRWGRRRRWHLLRKRTMTFTCSTRQTPKRIQDLEAHASFTEPLDIMAFSLIPGEADGGEAEDFCTQRLVELGQIKHSAQTTFKTCNHLESQWQLSMGYFQTTLTSTVPKIMAQDPKIESIANTGSMVVGYVGIAGTSYFRVKLQLPSMLGYLAFHFSSAAPRAPPAGSEAAAQRLASSMSYG